MASCCFHASLLPHSSVRFLHHHSHRHHQHHLPFHHPRPLQTRANSALSPKHGNRAYLTPPSSYSDPNFPSNKKYRENDGIVIVDHGSRRAQSNSMIDAFVDLFKQETGHLNVEPAHMELASPTIKEAFAKCVDNGATRVIISPYFLSPGRHWDKDIPALASEAAREHPNIPYIVTAPIGLHPLMVDILQDRINYCLSQASGEASECKMCMGTGRCKLLESS